MFFRLLNLLFIFILLSFHFSVLADSQIEEERYLPFKFKVREAVNYKISLDSWDTLLGYLEESRQNREIIEGMRIRVESKRSYREYSDDGDVIDCIEVTDKVVTVVDIDEKNIYMLEDGKTSVVGESEICGKPRKIKKIISKKISEVVALPSQLLRDNNMIVLKTKLPEKETSDTNSNVKYVARQYLLDGQERRVELCLGRSALSDVVFTYSKYSTDYGDKEIYTEKILELEDSSIEALNKINLEDAKGYAKYLAERSELI